MSRTILAAMTVAVASFVPSAVGAQARSLGVFADLAGEWDGEAWMMRPEGRVTVRQREWVWPEAGGTIVAVRGLGTREHAAGLDTVHHAFAVIHRNRENTGIQMRAFTAEGHWLDPEIALTEKGYTWKMFDPRAGHIRYDMFIDDQGRWVENGYMSRDEGKTWMQFMGMVLRRQ